MRRVRLASAGLALAAALALLASGCGDDGSSGIATAGGDAAAAAAEEELTDHERGLAFAECMRENGVDMPDPDPEGGGGGVIMREGDTDRETLEAALEACRELLPERAGPAEWDPERAEQAREFAACMRDNGIDVPDPDPNGGMRFDGDSDIDPNSPEFQDAMDACQDLLPGLGGGGGDQ